MIDGNKENNQKILDTKDIMQTTMHSNNQDRHLLIYNGKLEHPIN